MEWQSVGTILTSGDYVFTLAVTGTLFKLKHITESPKRSSLKIAIRQAFEDDGNIALFDYKLINCKVEQDILLFSLPRGLNNRKLAFKRVDNYLSENWLIEIESLEIVEDGVNLPITISDVTDLQQRLNSIQDELVLKALDLDLDSHTTNTNNPHGITALQVGADPTGSAIAAVTIHEGTTNHPVATTSARGMMASSDKSKLDAVESGATANQTNAYLINRFNHTGTQPISTVDNLSNLLATFVNKTLDQTIGGNKKFTDSVQVNGTLSTDSTVKGVGYYYKNIPCNLEISRELSPQINDFVEIGTFLLENGGINFRLSLSASNINFSVAKTYTVSTIYSPSDTGWLRLNPDKSRVYFGFNNCDIDIKLNAATTYLRLRRTGGTADGATAKIRLEFVGNTDTVFTQTNVFGNDPNVTESY